MGAKNSATTSGNKQGPDTKGMHKCGEVAGYGSLCNSGKANRADGSRVWERDHIPAKATLFRRAKVLFKTMSEAVYDCAKGKIESRGMAVVIPRTSHRNFSPTCGSNNDAAKIATDSKSKANMDAAVKRDTDAMQKHMDKDIPQCAAAYAAAVEKIKDFDFDAMIKKAVKECGG
jgi:hypothetical protein